MKVFVKQGDKLDIIVTNGNKTIAEISYSFPAIISEANNHINRKKKIVSRATRKKLSNSLLQYWAKKKNQ